MSFKLILSLTVIVILVSSAYALYHIQAQRQQILDTMILGADQLSKGITSATWHAMLADNRAAAYEIMHKSPNSRASTGSASSIAKAGSCIRPTPPKSIASKAKPRQPVPPAMAPARSGSHSPSAPVYASWMLLRSIGS
ncbi:MAG: hypothetical protein IPJ98_28385 [Bryobacterales bacterium]|nr:hypothetical protein [Bryobacterales bacterium]